MLRIYFQEVARKKNGSFGITSAFSGRACNQRRGNGEVCTVEYYTLSTLSFINYYYGRCYWPHRYPIWCSNLSSSNSPYISLYHYAQLIFKILGLLELFDRICLSKISPLSQAHLPPNQPRQPQSKFLELPGEIRNKIYRLVLVSDDNIDITITPTPEPALLNVCRTTLEEATTIYYLENSFTADFLN